LNLLWAPAEGESFPEPVVFAWGPASDPEQGAGLVLATTAMNLPSGMRRHFVPLGDPSAMREMPGTKAVLANLPVHPNSTLSAPSAAIGVIKTAWLQSNSGEIEVAHAEGVVARPAPNRRQSVIAFMHSDLFLSPAPGNNWAMPFEVVDDLGRRDANLWPTKSGLMQDETYMGGEGDEQVPTIRLSYGGRTLGWNGEVHGLETPEGDPARRLFDGAVQIEDAEVFVLPDGMLLGIETGAAAGRQVLLYRLEPAGEAAR
jgi:hypothetical protein